MGEAKPETLTADARERLTLVGERALQRLVQERDAARERIAELEQRTVALAARDIGWKMQAEQEQARADAAEARERKLVEALRAARRGVQVIVGLTQHDEMSRRDVLATIDAALSPYTPAAPEMPADCHPQGE